MRMIFKNILLIGAVLALAACSKPDIIPSDDIYQNGGSVMVMWTGPEHAGHYRLDHGGILGAIASEIGAKAKDYVKQLESLETAPIVEDHYLKPYSQELSNKGLSVSVVNLALDYKKLREKRSKTRKEAPYDFTYLKTEKNADFVLFLSIDQFGVSANSAYGVETSRKSNANFYIYLIDTSDNSILGRYHFKNLGRISKNWKGNNYEQLLDDVAKQLIEGLEEAYFGFFEQ